MITFKSIAQSIEPTWELQDWFQWPPNIFALVSIVLQRTGAYRVCIEEAPHWEGPNWKRRIELDAEKWALHAGKGIAQLLPFTFDPTHFDILKEHYQNLKDDWDSMPLNTVDLNRLRSLGEGLNIRSGENGKTRKFAIALCTILAISDSSASGIGMTNSGMDDDSETLLFRAFANLLLTNTGSVSTIDKFHGAVFPKTRTPRSGIVLRSLSHNLTFHQTEVEVIWRTCPWFDEHKQFMNVMVVPYPFAIDKNDFVAVKPNTHIDRYFKGKIKEETEKETLQAIVLEIFKSHREKNTIDLLVFPEMSLSETQYGYLLNYFAERLTIEINNGSKEGALGLIPENLPIVVAGVLSNNEEGNENEMSPLNNEARIAVFFYGKWYDITQRKHHRWQLNRDQIRQYDLESYLSADKKWVELCTIKQRRLTVLAPNGWLTLSALICEDLARQEPVGEVLRGIGPTLLTALLSDGPQIGGGWSARYANVLADDPGTSVLSVTSKGMAARSRKSDGNRTEKDKALTIGLWRDLVQGSTELELDRDSHAIIFTISSNYEKEYTLDGRCDGGVSSVFRMDSMKPVQVKFDLKDESSIDKNVRVEPSSSSDPDLETTTPQIIPPEIIQNANLGNWHDIRALSAVTFAVDSIVDLCIINDRETIGKSALLILQLFKTKSTKSPGVFNGIIQNITKAWDTPSKVGTSTREEEGSQMFENIAVIKAISFIIDEFLIKIEMETLPARYLKLTKICARNYKNADQDNTTFKAVQLIFLNNMQSKIAAIREMRKIMNNGDYSDPFEEISKRLIESIRKVSFRSPGNISPEGSNQS
jgi:predicted amidohydrolase